MRWIESITDYRITIQMAADTESPTANRRTPTFATSSTRNSTSRLTQEAEADPDLRFAGDYPALIS